MTVAEYGLIYQALGEAASYTRSEVRKRAYLDLRKKMKEERDGLTVVVGGEEARDAVQARGRGWDRIEGSRSEG